MVNFNLPKGLRPTRVVLTEWLHGSDKPEYKFKARLSESVFGQALVKTDVPEQQVVIAADGWFDEASSRNLIAQLRGQSDSLRLSDLPQIAKVYGAWVYLDKGRAYGLKMDDRLVVSGREAEIKGHVVLWSWAWFGITTWLSDSGGRNCLHPAWSKRNSARPNAGF
jgi:hypothetical protein